MRLALLGLAASLSTLPSFAEVAPDLRVSQSPVTIAATFSRPGETAAPVTRPDGDVNVRTPLDRVRYGNSQLLRTFFAAVETQEPKITDIKGWSIVAVWANWPGVGNSYKFFARKGAERREIPETLLKLDLVDPFVGKNVRLADGVITSGTEKHKIYATLTLGAITVTDGDDDNDDPRPTASGAATGLVFGTGSYIRPTGATAAIYRPIKDTFTGYGQIDNPDGQEDDVLSVTVKVGQSSAVAASLYASGTPTEPSNGPGTDVSPSTNSGFTSGTLSLGGSGSLMINDTLAYAGSTTVHNGTLMIDGSLIAPLIVVDGDALSGGDGSLTLTFGHAGNATFTFAPDIVLGSGGTLTLAPTLNLGSAQ